MGYQPKGYQPKQKKPKYTKVVECTLDRSLYRDEKGRLQPYVPMYISQQINYIGSFSELPQNASYCDCCYCNGNVYLYTSDNKWIELYKEAETNWIKNNKQDKHLSKCPCCGAPLSPYQEKCDYCGSWT